MALTSQKSTGADIPVQPPYPSSLGPGNGRPGFLSILCVSENPLFRDRICRNLERDGSIFVEIAVTAEDALHMMAYIFFDVIVTDCISWKGSENGFLKAIREQAVRIPVIYFTSDLRIRIREEAARLGHARVIMWNGHPDTLQYENLLQCMREMTDGRTGHEALMQIP